MKSLVLIAVLAALAVCNGAVTITEEAVQYEDESIVYRKDINMFQKGDVRLGAVLFHTHTCNVPGIPGSVVREDVVYLGNATTRITGLRMNRLPAHINVGALGTTHLTIRLTSAEGEGIFSTFEFWGDYTDWV